MIGLNDIVQEITGNYEPVGKFYLFSSTVHDMVKWDSSRNSEKVWKFYLFSSTVHDMVKWDRTGNDEKVYLTQYTAE